LADFPETGEFVVGTVKKIMPYGGFCTLDEYGGMDSFLHVSQVSSGWIRNIREHLREGQKIVAKVITLDREKGQVDLSLKQVTEADRKRKLASFQAEKKARKLIEVAGAKLNRTPQDAWAEFGQPLLNKYGSVADGLQAIADGAEIEELPKVWVDALKDIVAKEFKAKTVHVRKDLVLTCPTGDGVALLSRALEMVQGLSDKKVSVHVHYVAAPNYFIEITASDYKTAEKKMHKVREAIASACEGTCEFSISQ
jgi:translation initiation factor 2 subunit 1